MSNLTIELRQALRSLLRSPGFCAVALVTLALGIGANTAIFSAVDAVLLRGLPYPEPGRLVALWTDATKRDMPRTEWTNSDAVADWRKGLGSVQALAAYGGQQPTLTGIGDPERIFAADVQHQMFDVLGVRPERGRALSAEDDVPNGPSVVVVSHAFWQQKLGGAEDLSKLSVTLDGKPYAVVGVMPPGFSQPTLPDRSVWRPLQAKGNDRGGFYLRVLARLKPGRGVADAQAEFDLLASQLAQAYPDSQKSLGGYVQPLQEAVSGPVRMQLLALMAATLLVLLIACANLANLLLARASARGREFAVRAALGAQRRHLARQLLCESALLGLAGAVLGVLLAMLAIGALGSALPDGITDTAPLRIDARVLGFALLAGVGATLMFGSVPMLAASRPGVAATLRSGERGSTTGPASQRVRGALVVFNFALALALCMAGGLFFQSLRELSRTDLGFRTERLLTFQLNLPDARYPDRPATAAFHATLLDRLRALPGVTQVGLSSTIPLAGDGTDTRFAIEGAPPVSDDEQPRAWYSVVSSQYLEAMGIDLLRGRTFAPGDDQSSALVLVVNHAFAKANFGGDEQAIGHRLVTGKDDKRRFWEIVGVAEDVRFFGVDQPQAPSVYLSLAQRPAGFFSVVVRAAVDPESLLASIRREIGAIDPSLALANVRTMDGLVADSERGPRLIANLVGGFAALALLLAAVGVYGVIAYAVSLRTREFGVRLALGARRGRLVAQVLRSGLVLAALGIVLGTGVALALGRAVQGLLYQVKPFEPGILLTVAALLGATAVLATLAPALRASRVDPMVALREE